jgi:hypothetical protein
MTPIRCKSARLLARTLPNDRVSAGGLGESRVATTCRDPRRRSEGARWLTSQRSRVLMASVATCAVLCVSGSVARAGEYAALEAPATDDKAANEVLLKKLQAMEKRINSLETQLKQKGKAGINGTNGSSQRFGCSGESEPR